MSKSCADEMDFMDGPMNSSRIWVHSFSEGAAQQFADQVFDAVEKNPNQPIIVYIDSGGGEIDGLMAMLSVMDSVQNHFVTVALGKAMSAGAVLLSHGDTRCIGIHSRSMIHEVSGGAMGSVNDLSTENTEIQRVNNYLMELLAKNCKKTSKQLKKLLSTQREMYMDAEQSLKFGLVDRIGVPLVVKRNDFEFGFITGVK
jgi:ATP-dependent Clp protease protease subunit